MDPKKIAWNLLSFALATVAVCIANFILQFVLIFVDIVSRMDSSSLMIIVLWLVTGVFGAVITVSLAEQFLGKGQFTYKLSGITVTVVSAIAIVAAILLFGKSYFNRSASDFSLLFSNGYVFISYFAGAGIMGLILKNLDK